MTHNKKQGDHNKDKDLSYQEGVEAERERIKVLSKSIHKDDRDQSYLINYNGADLDKEYNCALTDLLNAITSKEEKI